MAEDDAPPIAAYGWNASQYVLQPLNPPPRFQTAPRARAARPGAGHIMVRREAVRREIDTFLKAEERRQAGIKKLLETIHVIDTLDTDFGTFAQFGRTLRSELGDLKRKLRTTQRSFAAADGGFLQTYAMARKRRIRDAERWEGRGGEVDYDLNAKKSGVIADLDSDEDPAVQARLRMEQDMIDIDLRLDKIWDEDVMLITDIELLLQEAKEIKEACTGTMLNLTMRSNELHVRLESWHTNIIKVAAALTEDAATTFDLQAVPEGKPPVVSAEGVAQGSVEEYLAESKGNVDAIFASMAERRDKAFRLTEQFADKTAEVTAEIRAENERLKALLAAKQEEHLAALKAKDQAMSEAEAEHVKQRKALMADYAKIVAKHDHEVDGLTTRFRAELDSANLALEDRDQALEALKNKADALAAQLQEGSERLKQNSRALKEALSERDALADSIESERSRVNSLQKIVDELQALLDANGDDDGRLKLVEDQLKAARKKLMDEESKSIELEGSIRTLEREKASLKKHAAKLQEKVSGVDSQLLDTISMAKSDFAEITGNTARPGLTSSTGKSKTNADERAKRDQERNEELAALKDKQSREVAAARHAADEAMKAKDQNHLALKQQMQEKMQGLLEQMRLQKSEKKLEKKEKMVKKDKKEKKSKQPRQVDPLTAEDASQQAQNDTQRDEVTAPSHPSPEAASSRDAPKMTLTPAAHTLGYGTTPEEMASTQLPIITEGTGVRLMSASAEAAPTLAPLPLSLLDSSSAPVLHQPPAFTDVRGSDAFITQQTTGETAQEQQVEAALDSEVSASDETGEDETEDEDSEDEMHKALEAQQRELEEQVRIMEEQYQREIQEERDREEERLHKLRLEATKELQRVTDMQALSDSDSDFEQFGEAEAHGVLDKIGNTVSNTTSAVSNIQNVIKEQHQEMAKILQASKDETKAEVTKTKANYQMKLAVGLLGNLRKENPPAPAVARLAEPAADTPHLPAKTATPVPPREEDTPPPLIKPLGKATSLPSGQAPSSGWVPARPPLHTSKKFRALHAPAILQEEFADQFGGQHRVRTAALPVQPAFAARQGPPSLMLPPKRLAIRGIEMQVVLEPDTESRKDGVQRPLTARARMQHDETPFKPRCDSARQVYDSLFYDAPIPTRPRRPVSARTSRQNAQSAFSSQSQEALTQMYSSEIMVGAVVGPAFGQTQVQLLHTSHFNPAGEAEMKGTLARGSRRRMPALAKHKPPSLSRFTAIGREEATGGMLASSPALTRWATSGRDSKDQAFIHTIISSARMDIRPATTSTPRNKGSRLSSGGSASRSQLSPSHKITLSGQTK